MPGRAREKQGRELTERPNLGQPAQTPLILPAPASFPQPEKFRQSVRQCGRQRDAKTIVGALLIGVVDGLSTWQHALVQDAAHQDAGRLAAEEDDVAGLLGTQQPGTDVIARSTQDGRVGLSFANRSSGRRAGGTEADPGSAAGSTWCSCVGPRGPRSVSL